MHCKEKTYFFLIWVICKYFVWLPRVKMLFRKYFDYVLIF